MKRAATHSPSLRCKLCEILEQGSVLDGGSRLVSRALVILIVLNLVAAALETVPEFESRHRVLFALIEYGSLAVFTVEYGVRLWVAPENLSHRHLTSTRARLAYARSPAGLIDLVAILPFWFAFAVPSDLRVILVVRIARFLKLTRYSPAMRSLLEALYAERRALFGCLVILLGVTLIAATAMHLAEGHVQPEQFGTIPHAMWWAIATLGTIGYGDVVPITAVGRIIAALTILTGLILIGLPVGVVATAFADEVHRRQFVVTWGMVARVPLFAGLNAVEIADISRLLSAQTFASGETIVRRGEPAHSMYFIAAGEIEIDLKGEHKRLGQGHFFGEIAVLRNARRSATIIALKRTSLLVLEAKDLHALMDRDPRIAERIRGVAHDRLGRDFVTREGDLVMAEIEREPVSAR